MLRNMSNRSEPNISAQGRRAPLLASDGRRISYERLNAVYENPPLPDVGMTPDAFIATYLSSTGTDLSAQEMFAPDAMSAPPSMVSASSVGEAPHPMTRENSYVYTSPVVMERMTSFASYGADPLFDQGASDFQQPNGAWKGADLDNALLAIGDNFSFPASQQYAALENQTLLSPTSVPMERQDSAVSMQSTRSTASYVQRRAREARERVLQAGMATSIAPMPQMIPRLKAPSPAARQKQAIQQGVKAKQSRPRPAKLHCTQCNEYPEGFRGDHELRRHVSAKHVDVVKKYVCRDPTKLGLYTELKVIYPLAKCKACASGKQYGAYYNAAAHLRRTHFRVRPNRGRATVTTDEKRGGKGGGDWPAMSELKIWFEEVLVPGEGSCSPVAGDDPPEEDGVSLADDEEEEEMQEPAAYFDDNADPLNADPLGCGNVYGFASSDMPSSYMSQAAAGMASDFGDSDIELSASSQDSTASVDFHAMGDFSFDDLWTMQDAMSPV